MKAIQIISQDLFDKVRSRFQNLEMGDETGAITIDPKEARFFDFDFIHEGVNLGRVSISLGDLGSLKVYYSQGITENQDDIAKKMWYSFLKEMRLFAMRRLLRFDTRDIAKTNLDKNDFQQLAATQGPKEETMNMNESRWNNKSTKKTSRAVKGTTEVIVRHTESMDEMAPGLRSHPKKIKAIFIQNKDGERFKYPFIHPAGAFAMAQHVDHGGIPHDPAGKAIMRMSEQIAQLQEFQKQVKTATLHDDALGITERAVGRLHELKAQLEALSKRHHYESWIAEFNESDSLVSELDAATMEQYKAKFTQSSFNENLANLFPLIHSIMQETNTINLEDYVDTDLKEGVADITLNGKPVNLRSLEIDGVDRRDHPDYSDAYFSYGEYADGTQLTDDELERLTDERGDIVNQMANDSMYESGDSMEQFEAWAEAVESGDLTQDQKDSLKAELGNLTTPLDLDNAYQFFNQFGIESDSLEQKFDAAKEFPDMDPLEVFKAWAKEEGKEDLLNYIGLNTPAPQPEAPAPQPPAPEQPVAEGKDHGAVIQEVAKIVKSFYNKDNPNVGPFRGEEGIAIDVEKRISEKFGEEMGQQARALAEKYMAKLTQEWNERHGGTDMPVNQDDGLARLKELLGNVKAKVENIDGPKKSEIPAYMRKEKGGDWKTSAQDLEKEKERNISGPEGLKALKAKLGQSEDHNDTFDAKSHAYKTTMKHADNPTVQQRMAAHDIKPGIAGYKDRIDMLKDLERTGKLKKEDVSAFEDIMKLAGLAK